MQITSIPSLQSVSYRFFSVENMIYLLLGLFTLLMEDMGVQGVQVGVCPNI